MECFVCSHWWQQARGLMFSNRRNLLFIFSSSRKISLHSWFVFFPLNLIFLDEERRVIELGYLPSWSIYTSKTKAQYLIETPSKNGISNVISIGQQVQFSFLDSGTVIIR